MESINVDKIKGVGPKREELLKKIGINTIYDLLTFYPREYEDNSEYRSVKDAVVNTKNSFVLTITSPAKVYWPKRRFSILDCKAEDNTGKITLKWFNQHYLKNKLVPGKTYRVNGLVKGSKKNLEISNPVIEDIEKEDTIGIIKPIYSLTEGLTNNNMVGFIEDAILKSKDLIEEYLPEYLIDKYELLGIEKAYSNIHFPENKKMLFESKKRLVFDELLILQLGLFKIKAGNELNNKGIIFKDNQKTDEFIDKLPFTLTNAQKNVYKEIKEDMLSDKSMNRLVQGDVGSGKTVVAVLAILTAFYSRYQSALMVPTEILAKQHYESIKKFYKDIHINVELLTGSTKAKEKERILTELEDGKIDLIIGTHSLIEDNVKFKNLGLVVTDEQHRFGVMQRAILNSKGDNPDILVMTATPIPRSLALILYGDLDISIIDELPPGRQEIGTYAVDKSYIERMNGFLKSQLDDGRQAYVVAPLVDNSEEINAYSASELYEYYSKIYKDKKVALIHGQLKNKEKDEIMGMFKNKEIDLLVSTTVVEVGVDVPNANVMIIYNAERFGLAQLHQLRGRVGRGEYKSHCILVNDSVTEVSQKRMNIMTSSTDGFKISEEDLKLRGPGEFFGVRQHGLPELKIANLFQDIEVLKLVQEEAKEIVKRDPLLLNSEFTHLKRKIESFFKDIDLDMIGN